MMTSDWETLHDYYYGILMREQRGLEMQCGTLCGLEMQYGTLRERGKVKKWGRLRLCQRCESGRRDRKRKRECCERQLK